MFLFPQKRAAQTFALPPHFINLFYAAFFLDATTAAIAATTKMPA